VSLAPEKSRAEVRRRLEEAAAQLFSEQGYAATTVDQIVESAAVSKPALYRHFESKKDLYLSLLRRQREELAAAPLAELRAGQEAGREPEDMVPAMLDAWFAHVEGHPFAGRMLLRDVTGDPGIEAQHAELHREQVAADVELLRLVRPPLPAEQLEPLGEVVRSSLVGLALWWLEHPGTPRSVLVATMLRITGGIILTARADPGS
jgi:AcrR family transcriptional regulator